MLNKNAKGISLHAKKKKGKQKEILEFKAIHLRLTC